MKENVGNAATKAIFWCLAIKWLQSIKSKAIRQLYSTTVTFLSNYPSSTWFKPKDL